MVKTSRRFQQCTVFVASLAVSTEGFSGSPHSRFLTRLEQASESEDILALLDESVFLYSKLTESDVHKREVVCLVEDVAFALRSGDVKHDEDNSEISELLAIDQKFDEAIMQRSALMNVDQVSGSEDILALLDESVFLYSKLSESDARKQEVVSLVESVAFALRSGDVKHDEDNSKISEMLAIDQKFDEAIMQKLLKGGADSSGIITLAQDKRPKTVQELSTRMAQIKKLVSFPTGQPSLFAKFQPISSAGGKSEQSIEASQPPVVPTAKISSQVKVAKKNATVLTSFGPSCLDNLSTDASAEQRTEASVVQQAGNKTGGAVASAADASGFLTDKTTSPPVKVEEKDDHIPSTFGKVTLSGRQLRPGPPFGDQMVAKVQNSDDVVPAVAGENDLEIETLTTKTSPPVKKKSAVSAAIGAKFLAALTSKPSLAKPSSAKPSLAKPSPAKPSSAKPSSAKPSSAKPSSALKVDKKGRAAAPAFFASYVDDLSGDTLSPPKVGTKDVVVQNSSEPAPVEKKPASTSSTSTKSESLGDRLKSWLQL